MSPGRRPAEGPRVVINSDTFAPSALELLALEGDLHRLVDGPHRAFAELLDELEFAEADEVFAEDARGGHLGVVDGSIEMVAAVRRIAAAD